MSHEENLERTFKGFTSDSSDSCSLCLCDRGDMRPGELLSCAPNCTLGGRKDRICLQCKTKMDEIHNYEVQHGNPVYDSQDDTLEMVQQIANNEKKELGDKHCTTCSLVYRWLKYMDMDAEGLEYCQACKYEFRRCELRVYPGSKVCNKGIVNGREQVFHLLCTKCYNVNQEYNMDKEEKSCTVCTNKNPNPSSMHHIVTWINTTKTDLVGALKTQVRKVFVDGAPLINMCNNMNVHPVYATCEMCKNTKYDVNTCHLFGIACTRCNVDEMEAKKGFKHKHLVCTDCSTRINADNISNVLHES
jgi:hypothetical protein